MDTHACIVSRVEFESEDLGVNSASPSNSGIWIDWLLLSPFAKKNKDTMVRQGHRPHQLLGGRSCLSGPKLSLVSSTDGSLLTDHHEIPESVGLLCFHIEAPLPGNLF